MPDNTIVQNGITLSSAANGVLYQWIDCITNLPVPGATNQSFTTTEVIGTYAVVVSLNSCTDTSNCISVDQSGIHESAPVFEITPNPAQESVLISWGNQVLEMIEITDEAGKLVYRKVVDATQNQMEIPLTKMAAGLYHLHLISGSMVSIEKLIKR